MPVDPRRLLAIINPISGHGGAHRLDDKLRELGRLTGYAVELRHTEHAGHGRLLASQAQSEGFTVVAVGGGDGTISEVVDGLGPNGLPVLLIPSGTGNALGREIGAHKDPRRYAASLAEKRTLRRDLGRLSNGRLFCSFVGAGFEAECVRMYKERRTGSINPLSYVLMMGGIMVRAIAASNFSTLRLTIDGQQAVAGASWALAAISPVFGGPVRFVPHARPDDGRVDVLTMLDRVGLFTVNRMFWLGLLRRPRLSAAVRFSSGAEFTLEADERVPYQVDGDFEGYLPITAEVLPGALTLIAPA